MFYRVLVAVFCILLATNAGRADYSRSRTDFMSRDFVERIVLQWELTLTGHYVAMLDGDFGRRTYEGIRSFQAANGFPSDGVITSSQKVILASLAAAVRNIIGFEFIEDSRSLQEVGVPNKLVSIRESTARGTRWRAIDDKFVVETTAMPNSEVSYSELFQRLSAENRNRHVSYKVLKPKYFVITGTYKGKKFYTRMRPTPGATRGITISWAHEYPQEYEWVVLALAGAVFDLGQPNAATSADDDRLLIVVTILDRKDVAVGSAREYAETFKHTVVYGTNDGRYAISIGAVETSKSSDILVRLIESEALPHGSYLSSGHNLVSVVWETGDAAPSGREAPELQDAVGKSKEDEQPKLTSGSGFFISGEGIMLTNAHVAGNCDIIEISKYGPAKLRHIDRINDLALIELNEGSPSAHAVFQQSELRIGSEIVVLGYPLAQLLGSTLNVTSGHVSSLSGINGDSRFFQLSAPMQPGNSGGPVLDLTGRVVGVATERIDDFAAAEASGALPQNVNFALRSEVLAAFLRSAGVEFDSEDSTMKQEQADIAESAAQFTAQIWCLER